MPRNDAKGGLVLLACLVGVAVIRSWSLPVTLPASSVPSPSGVVASATSSPQIVGRALTGPAIAALAVRVAGAYRPEGFDGKFRLGSRKLKLNEQTLDGLASSLDMPTLSWNLNALRLLLEEPGPVDQEWPKESVEFSNPDTSASPDYVLYLTDPILDPKTPGRYYFLSGEGHEKYPAVGILTVDDRPVGEEPKVLLEYLTTVHPPMVPPRMLEERERRSRGEVRPTVRK